ncbi:30S ribosomal protein S2, partial [Planctomycetota bacterium]
CYKEARKLGIPIIALMDTDSDPQSADIVIPGNDDAYRSIEVVLSRLSKAVGGGRDRYKTQLAKQKAMEDQRRKEETKRQEEIRKARDAAVAERKKIEEENAAKIAEARKKHLAAKAATAAEKTPVEEQPSKG